MFPNPALLRKQPVPLHSPPPRSPSLNCSSHKSSLQGHCLKGPNYHVPSKNTHGSKSESTVTQTRSLKKQWGTINRWIDKDVAYIMEYYSATKKDKNLAICDNMDGPWRYKSDRERQIPYDFTPTWNLKYNTNELIDKTETDSQTENNLMVTKGERGWGRDKLGAWNWQIQIPIYKKHKQQGPTV